jgi:hypothetical protein
MNAEPVECKSQTKDAENTYGPTVPKHIYPLLLFTTITSSDTGIRASIAAEEVVYTSESKIQIVDTLTPFVGNDRCISNIRGNIMYFFGL